MKEELYNEPFENEEEKPIDYKAIIMEYLMYWPWIAGCAAAALVACFIYLRFQTPVYNVNATVLIKESDPKQGGRAASEEATCLRTCSRWA